MFNFFKNKSSEPVKYERVCIVRTKHFVHSTNITNINGTPFNINGTDSTMLLLCSQLPMTRTEETALLEEISSGSDHGERSGEEEEEEEGERGTGGKRKKSADQDDELIDL